MESKDKFNEELDPMISAATRSMKLVKKTHVVEISIRELEQATKPGREPLAKTVGKCHVNDPLMLRLCNVHNQYQLSSSKLSQTY